MSFDTTNLPLETIRSACPYCGEPIELIVDKTVDAQEYIEDCEVCCRPIVVAASIGSGGNLCVVLRDENG